MTFPKSLNLEVTTLCNARCIMCPHHDIKRDAFMPRDKFEKLVDEAYELGTRLFVLSQYGEPLLDKFLEQKVQYVRDKGADSFFFTNGSLMTRERAKALLDAGLSAVAFSFDAATKETYEAIRIGLNFEEVRDNIQGFIDLNKDNKCFVRIHATLLPENYEEAKTMESLWHGTFHLSVQPCEGRNEVPAFMDMSTEGPCAQPFTAMIVFSDGTVVPCCRDWEGSMPMGNAFDSGIKAVWEGRRFELFRYKLLNNKKKEIPLCSICKATY